MTVELKGQLAELDRRISTGITDKVCSYLEKHFATNHSHDQLYSLAKHLVDQRCKERRSKLHLVK